MKYTVARACGHEEIVEVYGPNKERECKIKWLERTVCSACYRAELEEAAAKECDEVEMLYREYKQDYADCLTKSGSYDKETKTIIVYVPREHEPDPEQEQVVAELEELGVTEEAARKWVNLGADGVQQLLDRMIAELERDKIEITPAIDQNLALGRKIIKVLKR